MNILINASNLSGGGGFQVADSIMRLLPKHNEHNFVIVGSTIFSETFESIADYPNIECIVYKYPRRDYRSLITHRNPFLDTLVNQKKIDCVVTVFGPMKWRPRCLHISGFALAHLVLSDSPFFKKLDWKHRLRWKCSIRLWSFIFKKNADIFFTENPMISAKLSKKFANKPVYTITNYYNQVFDRKDQQEYFYLPEYNGFQLLDIASAGIHKNQEIAIQVAYELKKINPEFKFRFIFTLKPDQFPQIPNDIKDNILLIGPVKVSQCPSLYDQVDACFQPTLLECFTATYVEGMRMKKPIVTTNLEFARGICGDAAEYYDATSPESAANAIWKVASDKDYYENLVGKGSTRLKIFDNQEERVRTLLEICKKEVNKR